MEMKNTEILTLKLDYNSLSMEVERLDETIDDPQVEYKMDVAEKNEEIECITNKISQFEDAAIEYYEVSELKLKKKT